MSIPLLTHSRLDIPPGSFVTVETTCEGTIVGRIFENPGTGFLSKDQNSFSLQLTDVTRKENDESITGVVTLFENEIKKVTLNAPATYSNTWKTSDQEIFMETHVIDTLNNLNNFIAHLSEDIVEMGCMFEFDLDNVEELKDAPPFGKVVWIIFSVLNILIPINVRKISEVEGLDSFWILLDKKIFSNAKVCKVFYDCKGAAEYLQFVCGITLKNVYDIRLAEVFILRNENEIEIDSKRNELDDEKRKKLSLGSLLSKYLKELVHPRDLLLLETPNYCKSGMNSEVDLETSTWCKFESASNHQQKQTLPLSKFNHNSFKVIAVQVKYLLYLKTELEKKLLEPLEKLCSRQIEYIIGANNATAHGFLSMPDHIGSYLLPDL